MPWTPGDAFLPPASTGWAAWRRGKGLGKGPGAPARHSAPPSRTYQWYDRKHRPPAPPAETPATAAGAGRMGVRQEEKR